MTRVLRLLAAAGCCATAAVFLAAITFSTVIACSIESDLRGWFAFDFPAPGGQVRDAVLIATHNLQLACAPLGGIVAIRYARASRPVVDCVLALALVANSGLVGAAVGAYGLALLSVLVPHGPLELAAFSLLGGSYLAARADELDLLAAAVATAIAGTLLVLAAACEAGLWLS